MGNIMQVKSYQDLLVWQKAMDYVVTCYKATKYFPKDETYGLIAQLKRSSVSVPSNIAEGYGRNTRGEYIQFLGIVQGSLKESETQMIVAFRLEFINKKQFDYVQTQSKEVGILLRRLIKSLKQKT